MEPFVHLWDTSVPMLLMKLWRTHAFIAENILAIWKWEASRKVIPRLEMTIGAMKVRAGSNAVKWGKKESHRDFPWLLR